ncbi:MAG TPA: lipase family protein [Mycobacterium sp.]|nr:lipase family protein [Mycobacterium sp.]
MAFDASAALNTALPLTQAAYTVMDGGTPALPKGFTQTSLIEADAAHTATLPDSHPAAAMMKDTNIFGLMGRNKTTRTAFLSFRGSSDLSDWLADFDFVPANYRPVSGFGQVHTGFQDVYECVRADIAANLAAATAGCDHILIVGHSLGAALAVLAAPDIARTKLGKPPNTIEPRLVTFGGPRVGLSDFAAAFDAAIECCYRVVNFLDIVPLVPPTPYVHVGTEISVDSGGPIDIGWRHSLAAYRDGLAKRIATQTASAAGA